MTRLNYLHAYISGLLCLLQLGISGVALAIETEVIGQLEDMLVIGEQEQQRQYSLPQSSSVFSTDFLGSSAIEDIDELKYLTSGLGGNLLGIQGSYTIRGIFSNSLSADADNSIGSFQDGVYTGKLTAFHHALFDVDQVAVLKGPQGTLLGRNTSAGAIVFNSRLPGDKFLVEAQGGFGNYGYYQGKLTMDLPISDVLVMRFASQYQHRQGYNRNTLLDEYNDTMESFLGRMVMEFTPQDNFRLRLIAEAEDINSTGTGYPAAGVFDVFDTAWQSDVPQFEKSFILGLNSRIEWIIKNTLKLTSITAYRDATVDGLFDLDGTASDRFRFGAPRDVDQFSQELRLTGRSNKVDWSLGWSYFNLVISQQDFINYNDFNVLAGRPIAANTLGFVHPAFAVCDATSISLLGPCSTNNRDFADAYGDAQSYAIYAELDWRPTTALSLNTGLRYTLDDRELTVFSPTATHLLANLSGNLVAQPTPNGPVQRGKTFSGWQPHVAIDYRLTDQTNIYSRVSRGYKSGGFESANIFSAPFAEETSWFYELGIGHQQPRYEAKLTAFRYDYSDLQVQIIQDLGAVTVNAQEVSGYGIETEIKLRPHLDWAIYTTMSYQQVEFDEFIAVDPRTGVSANFSGNSMIRSPELSAALQVNYSRLIMDALRFQIGATLVYESEQFFDVSNDKRFSQDAYSLLNLHAGVKDHSGHWDMRFYINNILDEEYLVDAQDYDVGTGVLHYRGAPRTYQLTFTMQF